MDRLGAKGQTGPSAVASNSKVQSDISQETALQSSNKNKERPSLSAVAVSIQVFLLPRPKTQTRLHHSQVINDLQTKCLSSLSDQQTSGLLLKGAYEACQAHTRASPITPSNQYYQQ